MSGCPNCAAQVDLDAALCGACGFDLHTSAGDEVRRLREAGRIRPGRLDPHERSVAPTDPRTGAEPQGSRAEHFDGGL